MTKRFPLATTSWDEAEYQAMQDVIATGQFSMGPKVKACEEAFAAYAGTRYSVMCNSGSSANLLMIAALRYTKNPALRLEKGDEVIVPAVSWSTTYSPLEQYGLHLRFVDIDLATLNFDLAALEAAITPRTRAIFCVNLLGNPNDFAVIQALADRHNLVVLEDNCESMGAEFNGRKTGSFGVMGSQSCFFSHHISTMEGGLVTTDDEELYHLMLSLRAHGWTRQLPLENQVVGRKGDDAFEESFRFVLPGYNLRPLEMSGAIGIEQIAKLPRLIEERRRNGALLQQNLSNHTDLMIQQEIGSSSWFGFSLVIRPGSTMTRTTLMQRLEALGFEYRPIVSGNFARKEVVRYFDHSIFGDLKNADHIDANGLFIGNHHYPIEEAVDALKTITAN
ncbi:pyridoxamine 5-phosphate oxidase [Sphingomonas sp. S-NIH.Pt1_0416]|uniref:DegT/DnrJ/EryC1/StrS family aminotransferase n=1 Tax=Sphingomonas sp. S-NIH.Pt1_0416 TaxID=1920123 RepID=UPI000F7ECF48|nr:DegT/DnrJ/EryC1/StrS family aminotransferase [Sphingomonas sp. S-NIH.Pt1_0416]RSU59833.1 pyridoxamine 5-phosphate oxidase [Sphingomonas sp. S-NIH.Pt1_0416]